MAVNKFFHGIHQVFSLRARNAKQHAKARQSRRNRRLLVENLQKRDLLAGDVEFYASVGTSDSHSYNAVLLDTQQSTEEPIGFAGFNAGLDVDPNTGLLYGGYSSLRRIDPDNREIRTVGNFRTANQATLSMRGLSFSPTGTLYGVSDNTLYTIDPTTAEATLVSVINTESASDTVFGIEFTGDGTLYAAGFQLMTLDPETAEIQTRVGRLDNYVTELDFAPDGSLYGVVGSNLHKRELIQIDPSNASQTVVAGFASDLSALVTRLAENAGPINSAPVARADSLTLSQGASAIVEVLVNDSDADGNELHIIEFTQGEHGSVIENGNGTLLYVPNVGYHGSDQFRYTIADGQGGLATATVDLTVTLYGGMFELFTLDPATGAVESTIGRLADYILEFDFAPDGSLYAVPGSSSLDGMITQINVSDASQTRIGLFASADLYGLVSLPVAGDSPNAAVAQGDTLVLSEDESATIDVLANDGDASRLTVTSPSIDATTTSRS